MKKKILAVALAVVILAVAAVGATLAWLMSTTQKITNTFTIGNVAITLTETGATDTNSDGFVDAKNYKLMPGAVYSKDPTITVDPDSEKCYLFVKLEQYNGAVITSNDPLEYGEASKAAFTCTPATGWNQLIVDEQPVAGVYYRVVDPTTPEFQAENGNKFPVLAGTTHATGEITVNSQLTQADITALQAAQTASSNDITKLPHLSVTAYAIQFDNVGDEDAAWAALNPTP